MKDVKTVEKFMMVNYIIDNHKKMPQMWHRKTIWIDCICAKNIIRYSAEKNNILKNHRNIQ